MLGGGGGAFGFQLGTNILKGKKEILLQYFKIMF